MPSVDPTAALAAGTLFVTPNKRLARALIAQHDVAQRATGRTAWPAAQAMPWSAWLAALWHDALTAGTLPAPGPLLAPGAAAYLWDRIVAADDALFDARGAATAAAGAWATFHAWRAPDDRFEAWMHSGIDDDAATFGRWATQFARTLRDLDVIDFAQWPDLLTTLAPQVPSWRARSVVLAGFIETSPQQDRVIAGLRAAGMLVEVMSLPVPRRAERMRVSAPNAQAELRMALAQARTWLLDAPDTRIGIVFDDLPVRRAEIHAAADDLLCPRAAGRADADLPRPYNISLGTRLLDEPLVSTAMSLIAWTAGPLAVADAAALMRARHLPGPDDAWLRRAFLERRWRQDGSADVTFGSVLAVLPEVDPDLAARWRAVLPPQSTRATPHVWAEAWRAWLAALGWPGDATLGSGEWQARDALWRVLGDFAALMDVAGTLNRGEAVAALRAALARTVFQPQTTDARIQILGTLEASGLDFDRLWITGLSAVRWPGGTAPDPLLPIAWQRMRGVPHADARNALRFARRTIASFAMAADVVVASHPAMEEEAPASVSSLIVEWPQGPVPVAPTFAGQTVAIAAARRVLETVDDRSGPPLLRGSQVGGGAGVIETQSECPFRAFARYRLRIREWPAEGVGLAPSERGVLLHGAMAAFWTAVVDHAHLCGLDEAELQREIAAAVSAAIGGIDPRRWQALPLPVAAAEAERLAAVLRGWLDDFERARPAFTVDACELKAALTLGELAFTLRIDRVDRLASGGTVVIDYKSGLAPALSQWFKVRPAGTQLGLYTLALRAARGDASMRAAAYARLKAGEIGLVGLAADAEAWPDLPAVATRRNLPVASWPEAEAHWQSAYGALAEAFRTGAAIVSPRTTEICERCGMQALCRVRSVDVPDDVDEGEPD